jgi:hypothetical protein
VLDGLKFEAAPGLAGVQQVDEPAAADQDRAGSTLDRLVK